MSETSNDKDASAGASRTSATSPSCHDLLTQEASQMPEQTGKSDPPKSFQGPKNQEAKNPLQDDCFDM